MTINSLDARIKTKIIRVIRIRIVITFIHIMGGSMKPAMDFKLPVSSDHGDFPTLVGMCFS